MNQYSARYVKGMKHLPGVTEEIAVALVEEGLLTVPMVLDAPDEKLLKIKGLTKSKITKLRGFKSIPKR